MAKTRFYTDTIPEGYVPLKTVDAKERKTAVAFTVVSLVLTVFWIVALFLICFIFIGPVTLEDVELSLLPEIVLIVSMVAYIVLHELTHGLFYKIFTHEKLTFGLTLTCAFCGVPNLYVRKAPMLVTILAPFVVFSLVFGVPLFFIKDWIWFLVFAILFAVHFGGCVGDLYLSLWVIFKTRGLDILVNDTGPKQTIYVKESNHHDI